MCNGTGERSGSPQGTRSTASGPGFPECLRHCLRSAETCRRRFKYDIRQRSCAEGTTRKRPSANAFRAGVAPMKRSRSPHLLRDQRLECPRSGPSPGNCSADAEPFAGKESNRSIRTSTPLSARNSPTKTRVAPADRAPRIELTRRHAVMYDDARCARLADFCTKGVATEHALEQEQVSPSHQHALGREMKKPAKRAPPIMQASATVRRIDADRTASAREPRIGAALAPATVQDIGCGLGCAARRVEQRECPLRFAGSSERA